MTGVAHYGTNIDHFAVTALHHTRHDSLKNKERQNRVVHPFLFSIAFYHFAPLCEKAATIAIFIHKMRLVFFSNCEMVLL